MEQYTDDTKPITRMCIIVTIKKEKGALLMNKIEININTIMGISTKT